MAIVVINKCDLILSLSRIYHNEFRANKVKGQGSGGGKGGSFLLHQSAGIDSAWHILRKLDGVFSSSSSSSSKKIISNLFC